MTNELEYLKTLKVGDKFKDPVDVNNSNPNMKKPKPPKMVVKTFKVIERKGELYGLAFELLPNKQYQSWEIKLPK